MADDEDEVGDELEAIWHPAIGDTSAQPKKALELVVSDGKEAYNGLIAKDRVETFLVRCVNGFRYRFFYHRINATATEDSYRNSLTVMTSDGVIKIYGQHLEAIDEALALKTCHTITEFSPVLHLQPTDKTKPFIERVEVTLPRPPKKQEGTGAKKQEEV